MRKATILVVVSALINGFLFNPVMGLLTVAGFGFVGFVELAADAGDAIPELKLIVGASHAIDEVLNTVHGPIEDILQLPTTLRV